MYYLKPDSRVLIGNCAISNALINQYVGTLCFETVEQDSNRFVDLSLSEQQLRDLVEAISGYLAYIEKYPVADERPLTPLFDVDAV